MEHVPLTIAVAGDLPALERWIARGGDVGVRDAMGNTPLCLAARHGHGRLVQALLDAGADIEAAGAWVGRTVLTRGFTPLLLSLEAGHTDVAALLIRAGARLDVADETGVTSLMLAARSAEAMVPRLLEGGADPDARDEEGWTVLMHAVAVGPAGAVAALLAVGADPEPRSADGESALSLAVQEQRPDVVDLLVAAGADRGGRSLDELRADAEGRDGFTLADARELLREYEERGADPEEDLEERLQEELAILFCEEGVVPPPGGVELEITGPGGAVVSAYGQDDGTSIFTLAPLDAPDLRISIRRGVFDRLDPAGGDLHRRVYDASRGFSLRLDHLALLLNSPRLGSWCERGGTLVCRLAEAPDATLSLRFAPTRHERACVLTFPLATLCGWLRRELTSAELLAQASVGGPDAVLARQLAEELG